MTAHSVFILPGSVACGECGYLLQQEGAFTPQKMEVVLACKTYSCSRRDIQLRLPLQKSALLEQLDA